MASGEKWQRDSDRLDRPLRASEPRIDTRAYIDGMREALRALESRNRALEDLCLRQDDALRENIRIINDLRTALARK